MDLVAKQLVQRLPDLAQLWAAPTLAQLNELAANHQCPVRFTDQTVRSAQHYERSVFEQRLVPTRIDSWHDRLNAAMWLLWPRSKLALNAGHVAELARQGDSQRSRRRDALTLLDEAGIVIVSTDPAVVEDNRRHHWHRLFVARRADWGASIQPLLIGHGLAEQCLNPYLGLTGKACHLTLTDSAASADKLLAQWIEQALRTPAQLLPFPVLGIPGWHPDNAQAWFYDNADYFRPRRSR